MRIYSTLSGQKEEFLPEGDKVKMYVCGVTPYDNAHIGHAMSYIIFDMVRRYLEYRGYGVKYVQNVTDIDDKLIDRANSTGNTVKELAEKYASSYFEDMDALNVKRVDIYPRATEEIPDMIKVIQGLVDKGHAYAAAGSVYFRVASVPDYGKLAHRNLESMIVGVRIEVGEEKENPMDFVLWKAAKPGEPSWVSPWGNGRPGWHIECSVMSLKYLGNSLDIHGGGQDLIFPHHENEIAQSESYTGSKPFVRFWMHNGLLQFGEEKMSKSVGNLITIKEALQKYSADAIRIFILSSHYRSPLTYSEAALEAAEKGAERLRQAANTEATGKNILIKADGKTYAQKFTEVMDDDFGTPQALAVLFDLAREINRIGEEGYNILRGRDVLVELAAVLGLSLELQEELSLEGKLHREAISLEQYATENFREELTTQLKERMSVYNNLYESFSSSSQFGHGNYGALDEAEQHTKIYDNELANLTVTLANAVDSISLQRIQESFRVISESAAKIVGSYSDFRQQLRREKHWQYADEIRDKLAELGISLEDTPTGTLLKHKR